MNERATTGERRERGSALMLMPAAVLVVIVLGAISVDAAVVFLAQRDLVNGAQAAANDAATYGLDESAFRAGRGYVYDPARVEEVIERALGSRNVVARHRWAREGPSIVVELERPVASVFAKAVPGGADRTVVKARATAQLRDGP